MTITYRSLVSVLTVKWSLFGLFGCQCRQICEQCDFVITTAMDPLVIQPPSFQQVTLQTIANQDLVRVQWQISL